MRKLILIFLSTLLFLMGCGAENLPFIRTEEIISIEVANALSSTMPERIVLRQDIAKVISMYKQAEESSEKASRSTMTMDIYFHDGARMRIWESSADDVVIIDHIKKDKTDVYVAKAPDLAKFLKSKEKKRN